MLVAKEFDGLCQTKGRKRKKVYLNLDANQILFYENNTLINVI